MRASADGRDALPSRTEIYLLGSIDTDDVPTNVPIALLIINLMRHDQLDGRYGDAEIWQALEALYCEAYVVGHCVPQLEAGLNVAGATRAYLELPRAFAQCVELRLGIERCAGRLVVRLTGSREWKPPLWMCHPAFEVTRG
jgi:hypothetical protein